MPLPPVGATDVYYAERGVEGGGATLEFGAGGTRGGGAWGRGDEEERAWGRGMVGRGGIGGFGGGPVFGGGGRSVAESGNEKVAEEAGGGWAGGRGEWGAGEEPGGKGETAEEIAAVGTDEDNCRIVSGSPGAMSDWASAGGVGSPIARVVKVG